MRELRAIFRCPSTIRLTILLIWVGIGPAMAADNSQRSVVDALGHPYRVGMPPQRIVSLSPNLTEALFAIGVDPRRIVGVTRFCNYPPAAALLPRIGGIIDPSIEVILAVRPDLVLATRGNPIAVIDRLRSVGVPVFAFDSQGGLDLVLETMTQLEAIAQPEDTVMADSAIATFRSEMGCLRAVSAGIPPTGRPMVFYYDPASPDWTSGPGTHVSEAIWTAGGRNAADDAPIAWPRYSDEALVAKNPDALLIATAGGDTGRVAAQAMLEALRGQRGWRGITAIREGRLCLVPGDWLLRPGPRLLWAVRSLGRCLHPDLHWGCKER